MAPRAGKAAQRKVDNVCLGVTLSCEPFPTLMEEPVPTDNSPDPLTITNVYNNIPDDPHLTTDWGFGATIEHHGQVMLFDAGANGQILLQNMQTLANDPACIQYVVLSHIHNDHTGGLAAFLDVSSRQPVYLLSSSGEPFIQQTQRMTEVIETTTPAQIISSVRTIQMVTIVPATTFATIIPTI